MAYFTNAKLVVRGMSWGTVDARLQHSEGAPSKLALTIHRQGVDEFAALELQAPIWVELETGERIDIDIPSSSCEGLVTAHVLFDSQLEQLGLI